MTPLTERQLTYRADIDGLRAIAVLAVLLFHMSLGTPGGFVGVDVFFVISGFLITSQIIKDLKTGTFRFVDFWERRVRRIFPALIAVVVVTLLCGWFLLLPVDFKELGESVVAQGFLVSNFFFWRQSGYFAHASEVKPLLHTWSLAVEEQFYLFFPFVMVYLKRFTPKITIWVICLVIVASFTLSVWLGSVRPSTNFYLLPTRAWELLIGSLLAVVPTWRAASRWMCEVISFTGLFAIAFAMAKFGRETQVPGVAALLPCVGSGAIIWANGNSQTLVKKLLSWSPLVFIGTISYSLYLWHWPVIVFTKCRSLPISVNMVLLLAIASFGLAILSWKYVETPFRSRVIFKRRSLLFSLVGVTIITLIIAGFAISAFQGVPQRIPSAALEYANGAQDIGQRPQLELEDARRERFTELGVTGAEKPVELFVWGDSHAMVLLQMLDALCKEHGVRGQAATHSATAPLLGFESTNEHSLRGDSVAFNSAVLNSIQKRNIRVVVLAAMWGRFGSDTGEIRRCLLRTIQVLHASGIRVWVMRQVPRPGVNVPRALAAAVMYRTGDPEALAFPLGGYEEDRHLQDQIFSNLPTRMVTILDPVSFFVTAKTPLLVAAGGKALFFDDNHLSIVGTLRMRSLFEPLFELASPNGAGEQK